MRKPKPQHEETGWQEALAMLKRAAEAATADRPSRRRAAPSSSVRPESEADADLFRIELAYRLQASLCASLRPCSKHRCRRLGHCRELMRLGRLRDAQRARVARERDAAGKPEAGGATKGQRNH